MTILSRNDQKGRSMVEMLGVLAIIGVLSVGGISGYSKAMAKFKLTKAQDQITMLLMNVRTAFATSPSYSGLNVPNAIAYNIAPGDMVTTKITNTNNGTASGGALSSAFGGSVVVESCGESTSSLTQKCSTLDNQTGNVQYFAIEMNRLARETCVSLGSSDWGADGLVGMIINGKTHTAENLPLNMIQAGADCQVTNEYSTITWIYY